MIIGSLTLGVLQRLPSSRFTPTAKIQKKATRAEDGTMFSSRGWEKYSVAITGLAQDSFEDLRYEYQRTDAIDLYFIAPRKELLSPSGSTNNMFVSRRFRLDDADFYPIVQYPVGTSLPAASRTFANTTLYGQVALTFTPVAGTNTFLVKYYPIIAGEIMSLDTDYEWNEDSESYSLVFEEV